jgi:hypothetical protein
MGLFDSILGAVTGKTDSSGGASPLMGILGGLLAQSGGLQGLANLIPSLLQSLGGKQPRIRYQLYEHGSGGRLLWPSNGTQKPRYHVQWRSREGPRGFARPGVQPS